jgi:acetyl-CoA carboxylase biotin carboxylase subunit
MQRALDEFRIEGVATTIPLQRRILRSGEFERGEYSTRFLDEFLS